MAARLGDRYFALGVTAPMQPTGSWSLVDLRNESCPRRFHARAIGGVDFANDWPESLDAFIVEP